VRAICGELWLLNACQSGAVGKDLEASAATSLLRNGRQLIQTLTAALRHQWTQWLFLPIADWLSDAEMQDLACTLERGQQQVRDNVTGCADNTRSELHKPMRMCPALSHHGGGPGRGGVLIASVHGDEGRLPRPGPLRGSPRPSAPRSGRVPPPLRCSPTAARWRPLPAAVARLPLRSRKLGATAHRPPERLVLSGRRHLR